MTKEWIGWHFLKQDRKLRWGNDTRVMEKGSVVKVEGELKMCAHGLHASKRAIDALKYAPGTIVCKVALRGKILEEKDKACAEEREILEIADATRTVVSWACWCAEQVEQSPEGRNAIAAYAAADAAYAAADAAADAAGAAADAADAAACAAYAAGAAARAAYEKKYTEMDSKLTSMLNNLFAEQGESPCPD